MVFDSLPVEMRLHARWCFTGSSNDQNEQLHKAPHALINGMFQPIDVTNAQMHLLTFEEIYPLLEAYPARDIGYVLTKGDNLTCIDLDTKESTDVNVTARNVNLVESLRTYTEVSRSGEGLHLWIKGEVQSAIKTSDFEVYSDQRFIICTGQTFFDAPLLDDPELIASFNEKRKENDIDNTFQDQAQTKTDEQIIAEIEEHDHTCKFRALMTGDWDSYAEILHGQGNDMGFDASQADAAMMTIITYFTGNFDQCKRIWRSSALSDVTRRYPNDPTQQRKKARNIGTEYKLNRAISLGLTRNEQDRKQRELVIEQSKANVGAMLQQCKIQQTTNPIHKQRGIPYPPGRMGELARYMHDTSLKSVQLFAIVEALAVAAAMFGRVYNVSGTGLNIYMMVLASSGTGKSFLSKNPEKFFTILERQEKVMGVRKFIMTQKFTHENAMYKEFQERTSFTQCLSEFGKVFKNMVSVDNQGGALATVREQMTDIYSKSGAFDTVGGLRYTNQENVVDIKHSVSYSFLGESVAEPFFETVTADMFSDGFMSRFLVFEHESKIPYSNPDIVHAPPNELMKHMAQAALGVMRALGDPQNVQVFNVPFAPEMTAWSKHFDDECTDKANEKQADAVWTSLWTRCHLKVIKIAALLAVMDNPMQPLIVKEHIDWATNFVYAHNDLVTESIRTGRMGRADTDQGMSTIHDCMIGFFDKDTASLERKHKGAEAYKSNFCVPLEYIMHSCTRRAVFKTGNGYKKPRDHIRESLRDMEDSGFIQKVPQKDCVETFKTTAIVYRLLK